MDIKVGDKHTIEFVATEQGPDSPEFEKIVTACIAATATVRITFEIVHIPDVPKLEQVK